MPHTEIGLFYSFVVIVMVAGCFVALFVVGWGSMLGLLETNIQQLLQREDGDRNEDRNGNTVRWKEKGDDEKRRTKKDEESKLGKRPTETQNADHDQFGVQLRSQSEKQSPESKSTCCTTSPLRRKVGSSFESSSQDCMSSGTNLKLHVAHRSPRIGRRIQAAQKRNSQVS